METHHAVTRAEYEHELDMTLAESFPASDPPPWTFGVSSPADVDDTFVEARTPVARDGDRRNGHPPARSR